MLVARFVHILGVCLWIGGAVAALVLVVGSRAESVDVRAGVYRLLVRIHSLVIAVGALLTVGTGLLLTMWLMQRAGGEVLAAPRMWVMQGAGLLGGLLVLLVGLPTAVKMGNLAVPGERGEMLPQFERYRKRQAIVSSVAGVLALVALFAAVVLR